MSLCFLSFKKIKEFDVRSKVEQNSLRDLSFYFENGLLTLVQLMINYKRCSDDKPSFFGEAIRKFIDRIYPHVYGKYKNIDLLSNIRSQYESLISLFNENMEEKLFEEKSELESNCIFKPF